MLLIYSASFRRKQKGESGGVLKCWFSCGFSNPSSWAFIVFKHVDGSWDWVHSKFLLPRVLILVLLYALWGGIHVTNPRYFTQQDRVLIIHGKAIIRGGLFGQFLHDSGFDLQGAWTGLYHFLDQGLHIQCLFHQRLFKAGKCCWCNFSSIQQLPIPYPNWVM